MLRAPGVLARGMCCHLEKTVGGAACTGGVRPRGRVTGAPQQPAAPAQFCPAVAGPAGTVPAASSTADRFVISGDKGKAKQTTKSGKRSGGCGLLLLTIFQQF